jgi:hypothetical protein
MGHEAQTRKEEDKEEEEKQPTYKQEERQKQTINQSQALCFFLLFFFGCQIFWHLTKTGISTEVWEENGPFTACWEKACTYEKGVGGAQK